MSGDRTEASRRPGLDPGQPDRSRLGLGDIPMVLMYHAVDDTAYDPNLVAVTRARFARQLGWLRRLGLRGVTMGTLLAAMRAGDADGLVGITFDDGYASVVTNALPELRRHRFSATVFVVADRIGAANDWDDDTPWPLLSADQVGELATAGLEIGSHSATHARLAGLAAGQLAAEVRGSRETLRQLTGAEVRGFAYPYGSVDEASRQAVSDAGYDYACAVSAPRDSLGLTALPRVYVGQRDGLVRLAAKRLLFRRHIAPKGSHS